MVLARIDPAHCFLNVGAPWCNIHGMQFKWMGLRQNTETMMRTTVTMMMMMMMMVMMVMMMMLIVLRIQDEDEDQDVAGNDEEDDKEDGRYGQCTRKIIPARRTPCNPRTMEKMKWLCPWSGCRKKYQVPSILQPSQ